MVETLSLNKTTVLASIWTKIPFRIILLQLQCHRKAAAVSEPTTSSSDLSSVYQQIDQKAATTVERGETATDDRPDPGFPIYPIIDQETGESREVSVYTAPGAFMESIQRHHQLHHKCSRRPRQLQQLKMDEPAKRPKVAIKKS
jgi:hypothetical protein